MNEYRPSIFYDAECGFCRRMMRIVLRIDLLAGRRLTPVALQSEAAANLLAEIEESDRLASWHFVDRDNQVHSGGAAIAPLLKFWRWPRHAVAVVDRHPRAVDAIYRWVAAHRVGLGRLTRWLPDLPAA